MKHTNKKGFTLVELLIVIVVIGILFVVVVANVDFSTDAAKEAGVQSTFKSYQVACQTVGTQYSGFTSDVNTLVKYLNKRLDSELQLYTDDRGNIQSFAIDPWGTQIKVEYSEPENSKGQLKFISAGPDMTFYNNDDIITQIKCTIDNDIIIENPVNDINHTHSFTKEVTTSYFKKSDANCDSPALYYYSCSCGQKGTSTFSVGEKDPNVHEIVDDTFIPLANGKHLAKKTCTSCGAIIEEVEEEHDTTEGTICPVCGGPVHTHVFEEQVQTEKHKLCDADCTKPLTYYYSCSCGETGTSTFTVGNPTSHNFTKETTDYFASAATCKQPAQYYYSCTGCNAKGTETYSVGTVNDNHIGSDVTSYETLNSTQHNKIVKCSECGGQKSKTTENHSPTTGTCTLCNNHTHTWTETASAAYLASAANCQSAAKYYKSCSCGEKDISNTFTVGLPDPNVHVGNIINGSSADAHTKYSVCGHPASVTHSYTETITTPATCTTDGEKTLECECGYSKQETIPATGHTAGANATCDTPQTCIVCGTVINPAGGHIYDREVVDAEYFVSAATCKSPAKYNKSCSCGAEGTETFMVGSVDPDAHIGTVITTNGTEFVHSKYSECGHTVSATHSYAETITTPATCTTDGLKTLECECGYSKQEIITAKGHTAGADATCESDQLCIVCGAVLNEAGGHIYNKEVQSAEYFVSAANCQAPLTYNKSCSCGAKGNATFTVGEKNFNIHVSGCTIIKVSTDEICRRYSLCNTIVPGGHNYDYDCDTTCNNCDYVRAAYHSAGSDDNNCTTAVYCQYGCGEIVVSAMSHSYTNACDTTCNNLSGNCTAGNRTITHQWGAAQWSNIQNGQHQTCYRQCTVCYTTDNAVYITTVGHTGSSCVQRETWSCYAEFSNGDASNCSTSHEGDYGPHSMTRYGANMSQHWDYCTLCSYTTNHANHTVPSWTKTHVGEGRWKIAGTCNVCHQDLTHYHDVDGTEPCPYCNETVSHNWELISSTYGANCQTVGINTYECSYCGQQKTESNDKYGSHQYQQNGSSAGNCQEDGWIHYKCKFCSDNYYTYTGKGPHNITRYGKDMSQHWDYCTLCSYTTNHANHTVTSWTKTHVGEGRWKIAGTCNVCGKDLTHYHDVDGTEPCPYCDEEVSHDWQLISSTYGANCQTVGTDTYECSYCGATMSYANNKYGSHPMTRYNGVNNSQHWDTCDLCDYTSNYEYHECSPWYYEKISDGYYRIYGTCEICQGSAEHYHNIDSNEDCPYCDLVICEYSAYCHGSTMTFTCNIHGDSTSVSTSFVSSYTATNCSEYSVTYHRATYNGCTITCNGHPTQGAHASADVTAKYEWSNDHSSCTGTIYCKRCNATIEQETQSSSTRKYYTAKNCTETDKWEHYVDFSSAYLNDHACNCSMTGDIGGHSMIKTYRYGTCIVYAGYDYQCEYCTYSYFESLNVYGDHNYVVVQVIPATCGSYEREIQECTICNNRKTIDGFEYGDHVKFYYHGNETNNCWECSVCGGSASHDFNSESLCNDPNCNAVCNHSSTTTPYYTPADATSHNEYNDCFYCGKAIFVRQYSHDDWYGGTCNTCGYACPHTSGTYDIYTYVNASKHVLDKACNTCKAVVSSRTEAHKGNANSCMCRMEFN